MKKVVILSGPTATGKTGWAIKVAKAFDAEVVNFDSLLFYRELTIGTAKPTVAEQDSIPHHLVDIRSIREPINAADFTMLAGPVIESIHQRGKMVILVGGSGFYLQALVEGMWRSPTTPLEIEAKSDALFAEVGIAPFLEVLEKHDRESFHRLHANDHYRVRRAVEHFWATGAPFSSARDAFTPIPPPDWDLLHLHLDLPKEEHHALLIRRTELMLEQGLIAEVESLLQQGYSGTEKPLQSIGYKEILDWLNGVYGQDKRALVERIVINTRRLAKSQRTWFKKKQKETFDPRYDGEVLMARVQDFIRRE
jgi:tRNA dimethylallyltransferase